MPTTCSALRADVIGAGSPHRQPHFVTRLTEPQARDHVFESGYVFYAAKLQVVFIERADGGGYILNALRPLGSRHHDLLYRQVLRQDGLTEQDGAACQDHVAQVLAWIFHLCPPSPGLGHTRLSEDAAMRLAP